MDFVFIIGIESRTIYINKMFRLLSETEHIPGTDRRKVYLYEDDSEDAIMTDTEIYETEEEADNRVLMEELLEEERKATLKEEKSVKWKNPYETEPDSD